MRSSRWKRYKPKSSLQCLSGHSLIATVFVVIENAPVPFCSMAFSASGRDANRVRDTPRFLRRVDRRLGEGRIRPERDRLSLGLLLVNLGHE